MLVVWNCDACGVQLTVTAFRNEVVTCNCGCGQQYEVEFYQGARDRLDVRKIGGPRPVAKPIPIPEPELEPEPEVVSEPEPVIVPVSAPAPAPFKAKVRTKGRTKK